MSGVSKEQRIGNLREAKATLAIEDIHLHSDDEALILRGIEEGWSPERLRAEAIAHLVDAGVIPPNQVDVPAAAE